MSPLKERLMDLISQMDDPGILGDCLVEIDRLEGEVRILTRANELLILFAALPTS